MGNDRAKLTDLYGALANPEVTVKDYLARASRGAFVAGGGSTTSTFLLHLGKVREALGLDWPRVEKFNKPLSGNGTQYDGRGHQPDWYGSRGIDRSVRLPDDWEKTHPR
jgi:hypothetical protein